MATEKNFASSLNTEVTSYLRNKQLYTQVHVLCIYWEKNDVHPEQEIAKLRECFEDEYRYTVASLALPDDHTRDNRLQKELVGFVGDHSLAEDSLIVVYYGGHCGKNAKGKAQWAAFEKGGPTVQWHVAQQLLFAAYGDVLLILDCCNASIVMSGSKEHGRFELLAASADDVLTPLPGRTSFTYHLEKELRAHARQGISISKLGSLLRENPIITATPVTHDFARTSQTGIIVQRTADPGQGSFTQKPSGYMLFRASLSGDVSARQIAEWLKTAPPDNVTSVRIEAAVVNARELQSIVGLVQGTQKLFSQGSIFENLSFSAKQELVRAIRALDTTLATSSQLATNQDNKGDTSRIKETLERLEETSTAVCEAVETSVLTQLEPNFTQASADEVVEITGTRSAISLYQAYNDQDTINDIEELPRNNVNFTVTSTRFITGTVGESPAVFESYSYYANPETSRPYTATLRQVQKMTSLLCHPKITAFHVLPCLGFYHDTSQHNLAIAFRAPPFFDQNKKPITLLQMYEREKRVPLGHRLRLASALAVALNQFHMVGWVHKGIRSENVAFLFMKAPQDPASSDTVDIERTFVARQGSVDLARPYLFGFEYMRMGDDGTNLDTDNCLERNLYRHPDRWNEPLLSFEKGHDIYALGMVLTEIAFWKPIKKLANAPSDEIGKQMVVAEDVQKTVRARCNQDLPHLVGQQLYEAITACFDYMGATAGKDKYEAQRYYQTEIVARLKGIAGKV